MDLKGRIKIDGNSFDFFFLAMAHWQLGEKEQARQWNDKAVAWMDKNTPKDEELLRFRAEAEALLSGIRDPAAVAQLPADEQEACNKLWADVAKLLKKVEEKK